MTIKEIKKVKGTWVFLGAISGVSLTKAVNFEQRIINVTLVASQYLNRRRRKFGLERNISDLSMGKSDSLKRFFSENPVFATFRRTGILNELESNVVDITRDELAILASSQLGRGPRKSKAKPSLASPFRRDIQSYFFMNEAQKTWVQPNHLVGRFGILTLDELWKNFARKGFFSNLLNILQEKIPTIESWRKELKNALILIGQSQTTMDLSKAFLWNMIALEMLLTNREDKVSDKLPKRADAFLSWVTDWDSISFRRKISALYRKRNAMVHQGKREEIEPADVLFTDELLFNLLANIGLNTKTFPSKDELIDFCSKVEAEETLGTKKSKKIRPKKLMHFEKLLQPMHFEW